MLGTIGTIAFWIAFLIGLPVALAYLEPTGIGVLIGVLLIVGFPFWLYWSWRRD